MKDKPKVLHVVEAMGGGFSHTLSSLQTEYVMNLMLQ